MEPIQIRHKWEPKVVQSVFNRISDSNTTFNPAIPFRYVGEVCGVDFELDFEEHLSSERLQHTIHRLCHDTNETNKIHTVNWKGKPTKAKVQKR
eukprot:UN23342